MNKHLWAVLILIITFIAIATAGEVPEINVQEFTGSNKNAGWLWTVLASETIVMVVVWLAGKINGFLRNRLNERLYRAYEIVEMAVIATYQEYVRVVKERNTNHKLTIAEKNEALRIAKDKAFRIAREQGIDLFKVISEEMITSVIQRFVTEQKNSVLKAVSIPLPDLQP